VAPARYRRVFRRIHRGTLAVLQVRKAESRPTVGERPPA
jgi:hypothetical protein